ncbi:MAG: hypothetical protein RL247_1038 [Actinomycetota bacterium]|jgi:uncharacterized protein (DUF779 family)
MEQATSRVEFSDEAIELLKKLKAIHGGGFMFHQSGGCCDGSAPMCYTAGEFRVGGQDVLMAEIEVEGFDQPIPFYMSKEQFEYWKHTHLTIDAVDGRGSGFSLEAPEGKRFLTRSRVFTDDEYHYFESQPVTLGDGSQLVKASS